MITTLAISNDTEKLSYAYFEGAILKEYDRIGVDNLYELHEMLYQFAREKKLAFIVVIATDLDNVKRRTAIRLTKVRTILKLISEQLGIVYSTPSTHGWDKYMFGDKIQAKKLAIQKLEIVNKVFDLELEMGSQHVADAIILGSTFTQNRYKKLKVGYYGL